MRQKPLKQQFLAQEYRSCVHNEIKKIRDVMKYEAFIKEKTIKIEVV